MRTLAPWLVLTFVLGGCAHEVSRWPSPDGRFEVVVYQVPSLSIAMPGGGSDGPGEVEVVRRSDGASCGRASLPIRSMAVDLAFLGHEARINAVAAWDLRACTVELAPPQ